MTPKNIHLFSIISYFGLIIVLTINTIWLTPPDKFPIALILLFYIGPLFLAMKGLLAGLKRTHLWLSYLTLIYLMHAIMKFTYEGQIIAATLQLIFSTSLFACCLWYVKIYVKKTKVNQIVPENSSLQKE